MKFINCLSDLRHQKFMYAQETVCLIFIQFYNENKHLISSHRQTNLAVPMIILCDGDQLWSWAKRGGEGGEVDKSLWLLDKKKKWSAISRPWQRIERTFISCDADKQRCTCLTLKKLKKRKKHLSQPEDEMKRLFRISASETTWMNVNICKGTHREMGSKSSREKDSHICKLVPNNCFMLRVNYV